MRRGGGAKAEEPRRAWPEAKVEKGRQGDKLAERGNYQSEPGGPISYKTGAHMRGSALR